MIGATFTPTGIPAFASVSMARMRRSGVATNGSIARAFSGSQKGTLSVTLSLAVRWSSWRMSTSRSISGALVMTATGFRYSAQTSRQPRVSLSDASSGW